MKPQDRTRAIFTSKVEPTMRLLLAVLADYMNDQDVCWPGADSVAERTGLCERQTRDLLNDAEARGLIQRVMGDHRTKDITIDWTVLAEAAAPGTKRGGARATPAKTAPHPAKTAPLQTLHPGVQSLPVYPAKTAAPTGKDCTRSVHEASKEAYIPPTPREDEALIDAYIAKHAPGRRTPEPHPPDCDDWVALLDQQPHGARWARSIVSTAHILTFDAAQAMTKASFRATPGVGSAVADAVEEAFARNGMAFHDPKTPRVSRWQPIWDQILRREWPPPGPLRDALNAVGGAAAIGEMRRGYETDQKRQAFFDACDLHHRRPPDNHPPAK